MTPRFPCNSPGAPHTTIGLTWRVVLAFRATIQKKWHIRLAPRSPDFRCGFMPLGTLRPFGRSSRMPLCGCRRHAHHARKRLRTHPFRPHACSPRATCDLAFNSHRVKAPDQRSTSLLRSLSSAFPSRPSKPLTPSATPMQPPSRSRPFHWCSRAATLSPPQKPARAKPPRSRFLPWTSWAIAKATTAAPSCSS